MQRRGRVHRGRDGLTFQESSRTSISGSRWEFKEDLPRIGVAVLMNAPRSRDHWNGETLLDKLSHYSRSPQQRVVPSVYLRTLCLWSVQFSICRLLRCWLHYYTHTSLTLAARHENVWLHAFLISAQGRFTPAEAACGTHWIGGLVGPSSGLHTAVAKRKIPKLPVRESNPGRPTCSLVTILSSSYRCCCHVTQCEWNTRWRWVRWPNGARCWGECRDL